jgi:hypothetical protein
MVHRIWDLPGLFKAESGLGDERERGRGVEVAPIHGGPQPTGEITVFGVVARSDAQERPPPGAKDPATLGEDRSMVLSRYVDDCVVTNEGIEGAANNGKVRHFCRDDGEAGNMTPCTRKLGNGQIEPNHIVAQTGQTARYGNTGATAHVEYSRSRLQPTVQLDHQRGVRPIDGPSGVVSGSRLVIALSDKFASPIAQWCHVLE